MRDRLREQLSFLDDDLRGTSPVRRQYLEFKRRYPDCVLLFRLGDFFETFDDDARLVAAALDLTLTQRDLGRGARVPMAGIPAHAAESYIARLLAQGHRVAICDQVGTVPERGLVRREVVRVVTPGTLVEPSLLAAEANNYLASVWRAPAGGVGLAYADISTGELAATELAGDDALDALAAELARLAPAEILVSQGAAGAEDPALRGAVPEGSRVTACPPESFQPERARRAVLEHFGAPHLAALGFGDGTTGTRPASERLPVAVSALGALLAYLRETQAAALALLDRVHVYAVSGAMVLDAATRRNLELLEGGRSGARADSLLGVLDHTRTPMGARQLRAWISQPLRDLARLQRRQAAVAALVEAPLRRAELRDLLGQAGDLERLAGRAAQRLLGPRECLALRRGLEVVPAVRALLADPALAPLGPAADQLDPCTTVDDAIARTLADDPPAVFGEGTIRAGVSAPLDERRALSGDTKQVLAQLERRERERTGVRSLKIGYNRVFGYYLEVSNAVANSPTDHFQRAQFGAATVAELLDKLGYQRKQTLVHAERYVTPELKTLETRLQSAQEEALELERQLYQALLDELAAAAPAMRRTAAALARLDCLAALAEAAARYGYVRPELLAEGPLEIEQGRHPVVERRLPAGAFVPNDARLDSQDCQIVILTGPNMAGKSTYLRQVALIVLMAQIGSFVPATRARLGLVDRIFTRVGAQDDIASGHSTFMVEMVETAAILRAATRHSLVILDEVGRGTSTFDGMAIARAVVEYLHDHPRLGARTLFATHYHELADLERTRPRVKAYRMAVLEEGERVVFEHRVEPGGADRSYGVHVARLAGLPPAVTRRAAELVRELEQRGALVASPAPGPDSNGHAADCATHPVLAELRRLDVLALSPLEALAKLLDLQERAREA
ncbi:MAG: DNA mismatch repair protein MutS [Chloroflexi bacterium]|nr:DNA mismatch repair protein MutS [Chloroflexota bacterium]